MIRSDRRDVIGARVCPGGAASHPESTAWNATWVANHICYHEAGEYDRATFTLKKARPDLDDRAFAALWRRSPRPLFGLLERARSDRVRRFAADGLKTDFRASLREVEPAWVARLVGVQSAAVDEFVIWVLANVPKFEQGTFRTLGLHEAVLRLFDSPSDAARGYAAGYARAHARDLPVDELVRLADNDNAAVRGLAADLLQARDPRKDVGLEAWGRLLESRHGLELARSALQKHFGARELTPDWFRERLFTPSAAPFEFVQKFLLQVHPAESLGPGYFLGLLDAVDARPDIVPSPIARFAMDRLTKFDINAIDRDALRRSMLRPATAGAAVSWIESGRFDPKVLGLDFLKAMAFHPDWESDPWLVALRRDGPTWARGLSFDEARSEQVLGWLGDVRRFAPAELGFDWLLKFAARGEPRYHNVAVATMIKGFAPADFATAEAAETPDAGPTAVDLGGAPFLFTGKLAKMQRKEAEDKRARGNLDGQARAADRLTACLRDLVWAAGRLGVATDALAEAATSRPDDAEYRPIRLAAVLALAASEPSPAVTAALESAAMTGVHEIRAAAAQAIARRDPKRAAGLADRLLSDRVALHRQTLDDRVDVDATLRSAARQVHYQGVVLADLIHRGDVATLAAVAEDRSLPEAARLGAVEGLAEMVREPAEDVLRRVGLTTDENEEFRKAAWRGLRRSKRARQKAAAPRTEKAEVRS